jgi:TonB-dependent receptor
MLREQREAENIVNIVSEEQIISFPDLNAADAIQRVPGITLQRDQGEGRYVQLRGTPPELTNFNVNGIQLPSPESSVRTVGMDIFNASQIQTIEVAKVLTPDMNGDAIGGTVNLKTKRAESLEPEFSVVAAGGYNNLRQTPNGELQFTYSQRKGRIGFLVNSNYIRSEQGADNMEFDYEKGVFFGSEGIDNYHIQYTEVQLRHYDVTRERIGLSTTFDYHIDEFNLIYVNAMFNRFSDHETRFRKVYTLDDAISERTYLYGGIDHDVKDREKIQSLSTISMGGEHDVRFAELTYEVAWSAATEQQPDRMEAVFSNPGQAITTKFDITNPDFPTVSFPDQDNALNAFDYDNYRLDQLFFEDHQAEDRNIIGRLDLKIPYGKEKNGGYIKLGSLVQFKDKSRDITAQSYGAYFQQSNLYPSQGPPLSLTTVDGGFRENNLLNRGYEMSYMPDPELMRSFYERWPTLFVYGNAGITETLERTYAQDYTATENVQAYYAMARYNLGKLMALGGVRYERTDIGYEGYQLFKRSSGYFERLDTITDQRTVEFWLPNLQFKYSINPEFNVRAALTYSYARPNFRDVIPYRVQNERTEVRLGNPNLDYPAAMNLDLLVERYWKGRNIISGGVFYKQIDNFIFNYRIFGYEGDPREANLSKLEIELPLNGRSAFVSGAEAQLQTFFNRLPGIWKNFGVLANYTFTYSEGRISKRYPANNNLNIVQIGGDYTDFFNPDETEVIPLPGQAPNSLNFALFYDTPKFYFKVAANYNDVFLSTLGVDPDLDEYYGAQWRIDVNGYYQVNKVLQVFGDVRNVTNQPLRYYLGAPDNRRILLTEFYSFWARLGVRLRF